MEGGEDLKGLGGWQEYGQNMFKFKIALNANIYMCVYICIYVYIIF